MHSLKSEKYIIVDVDMGADDAWALLLLLKAAIETNIIVLAITLVHGNTSIDFAVRNAYRVLQSINRTDVSFFCSRKYSFRNYFPYDDRFRSIEEPPRHLYPAKCLS